MSIWEDSGLGKILKIKKFHLQNMVLSLYFDIVQLVVFAKCSVIIRIIKNIQYFYYLFMYHD